MTPMVAWKTGRRRGAAIGIAATRFAATADAKSFRRWAMLVDRALDAAKRGVALPRRSALVGSVGAAERTRTRRPPGPVVTRPARGEDDGKRRDHAGKTSKNHARLPISRYLEDTSVGGSRPTKETSSGEVRAFIGIGRLTLGVDCPVGPLELITSSADFVVVARRPAGM
jgi:hypothetical protein